jgi:hypothetical protein
MERRENSRRDTERETVTFIVEFYPKRNFNYSKVIGIDRIGKIGFVVSTSNAVAIQSLAASTSPNDSNTIPKLYLKYYIFHII